MKFIRRKTCGGKSKQQSRKKNSQAANKFPEIIQNVRCGKFDY
jgi:hypothetical protein